MNQPADHREPVVGAERHDQQPTTDDPSLAKIRELIARSSLGSAGALALRARTSPELAELVRELNDLRNRVTHSTPMTGDDLLDLTRLANQCDKLGLNDLAQWAHAELAAAHLHRLARSAEAAGDHDAATLWRARASTLHQSPATDRTS